VEVVAGLAIAALVVQHILHSRERQTLLDRIQFPQKVETERSPEPTGEQFHVPYEDIRVELEEMQS
jgi:hypothetical protein